MVTKNQIERLKKKLLPKNDYIEFNVCLKTEEEIENLKEDNKNIVVRGRAENDNEKTT